jgi:hypothetical protein
MAASHSKRPNRARAADVSALPRALTPEEIQAEIDRIDAGGDAWSDDDEEVTLDIKIPLDKIVSIKLTDAEFRILLEEARSLGVGHNSLAQKWLVERLRSKSKAKSA